MALPLGLGMVALLAGPLAFYAFFTGFQEYDDEGYLLISLREYARGGVLYDEVYSQYGPAYFQLVTGLFRVAGLAFAHTQGRALALALVIAAAILCAVATWRLSGSLLIASPPSCSSSRRSCRAAPSRCTPEPCSRSCSVA